VNEHLINLIFGLLIVLGVIVVVVAKTFRVAERLREQADRIEAAARRIELASGRMDPTDQKIVNRYTNARIDTLAQRQTNEGGP
jgi:hypothetical protein